jgi:hypothetical protein
MLLIMMIVTLWLKTYLNANFVVALGVKTPEFRHHIRGVDSPRLRISKVLSFAKRPNDGL